MERYKFYVESNTLEMSAGFARAAADVNSPEYELYRRMRNEIPDLKVVRKTHASPTSYKRKGSDKKTSYYPTKGLSYEKMEKFIKALPESKEYLETYETLCSLAKEMCPSPYAVVAKWFMAQFPKFRENPLFYVKNSVEIVDYAAFLESAA